VLQGFLSGFISFIIQTAKRSLSWMVYSPLRYSQLLYAVFFVGLFLASESHAAWAQSASPADAGSPAIFSSGGQNKWYLGYNGFRMLLEELGLTASTDLAGTLATPPQSVVVMFGDLSAITRDEWLQLRRFVAQGGSLLVASEQSFTLPGVTSFSKGPASTRNVADQYQGFADCMVLSELNAGHPLSTGLREIIVNKSGWLMSSEDESLDWQVIASLPDDCLPAVARNKPVLLAGLDATDDRGVMILAADQSLFSDGMLWHGDNSILAIQTSDLLCRGNRKRLTVYENRMTLPGYRESNSPPPTPPVPNPPPSGQQPPKVDPPEPDTSTILKIANKVIDEVQESDILNKTLKNRPRNVRPVAWLRTMLLILMVLFTLFVLWKLVQNRWHLLPNRHSRFLQSMYGVHSSRQLESSEFGGAVEVLARDLCRELTGSPVETVWQKMLADGKGAAVASLPRSLRKNLDELLSIATRGCRIHISRRKFQALGKAILELRAIHRKSPLVKA